MPGRNGSKGKPGERGEIGAMVGTENTFCAVSFITTICREEEVLVVCGENQDLMEPMGLM